MFFKKRKRVIPPAPKPASAPPQVPTPLPPGPLRRSPMGAMYGSGFDPDGK